MLQCHPFQQYCTSAALNQWYTATVTWPQELHGLDTMPNTDAGQTWCATHPHGNHTCVAALSLKHLAFIHSVSLAERLQH